MDSWKCAPDPFRYGEPLPLTEGFYPLGFPLLLRTNSTDIIEAARESWGEFASAFETPPIELRVAVTDDGPESPRGSFDGPRYRAQGHLLALVLDCDDFAVVDMEQCLGFASLTAGVARNHLFTSFHFLDFMAYACLGQRYLTAVHAACAARNGDGILLAGGPGTGKSCLAWGCARAGLSFVADDATWVVRHSEEPVVVGKCQRIRFKPEAMDLIPELRTLPRIESVIGKDSFEIRVADVPGLASSPRCRLWRVVFLDRRASGPAELVAVGREETRRRLREGMHLRETHVWKEQEASLEPLIERGGLLLRYSSLREAVGQILQL